ncbi:MAG: hypothetical protein ACRD26_22170 [Vicinamibacterales bacterium]
MISTRRLFLGTALGGALPLALDVQAFAQSAARGPDRDHVLDHIQRELASVLKGSTAAGTVRGEHVRLVASNLRLLGAHASARGIWIAAERHLGRAIRERGLASAATDTLSDATGRQLRADLARAGINMTAEQLARVLTPTDAGARERAVAQLHARGFARQITDIGEALERLARHADATIGPAVLARVSAQALSDACRDLWWQIFILQASIIAMAATGVGAIAIAQLAMALLFLDYYYSLMGC